MSREFGDNGSGFFHDKINNAMLDAREGGSAGAKLMAEMLSPLNEIAYAVASEESSGSDASNLMQVMYEQLPVIKQALYAMEHYVRPVKDARVAGVLPLIDRAITIHEEKDGHINVDCEKEIASSLGREVTTSAILKRLDGRFYLVGSTYASETSYMTYTFCSSEGDRGAGWYRNRVEELERQIKSEAIQSGN